MVSVDNVVETTEVSVLGWVMKGTIREVNKFVEKLNKWFCYLTPCNAELW